MARYTWITAAVYVVIYKDSTGNSQYRPPPTHGLEENNVYSVTHVSVKVMVDK